MSKQSSYTVMKEFRQRLQRTLKDLTESNGLEILGNLKVDVAELDTVALLKRNRIYLDVSASHYPEHVLRYILAHELAHLAVRNHSRKFWEIVMRICPD